MANGGVIAEARADGTAAVAPQEIGRDPAFIEEDVLLGVAQRRRHLLGVTSTTPAYRVQVKNAPASRGTARLRNLVIRFA